ncbi:MULTISPECIES: hypothetical protein [Streptomonospora]|uniref:Uncharacterized protein n=2 Tax=Streptomonospora TaxID=104204 RepID=A0ABV9SL41_9ACTN
MKIMDSVSRIGDRMLASVVPEATAQADQFECSWEQSCRLPYCGSNVFLTLYNRKVCAGTWEPSYGPWERVGCYC